MIIVQICPPPYHTPCCCSTVAPAYCSRGSPLGSLPTWGPARCFSSTPSTAAQLPLAARVILAPRAQLPHHHAPLFKKKPALARGRNFSATIHRPPPSQAPSSPPPLQRLSLLYLSIPLALSRVSGRVYFAKEKLPQTRSISSFT